MAIQSAHVNISHAEKRVQTNWLQRIELFILFLLCEVVIFLFGSHYFDVFPTNKDLTFNLSISALFLIISLWFRIDKRWNRYWPLAFAFFIASVAIPFTAYFDLWIRAVLQWFAVTVDTSRGLAIENICEMLLKVIPILVLVKLSGTDMGSIFLKRENLSLGLGIAALVFFLLAPASFMFSRRQISSYSPRCWQVPDERPQWNRLPY
jgi:hypothetical protein